MQTPLLLDDFQRRQIELVEFSERVHHVGLRHKGTNGTLYENKLIQYLRRDVEELDFFRGQIRSDSKSSAQYDTLICKKGVEQEEFLREVDPLVNIVDEPNCLGVIELKKWGNPKMVSATGPINAAYNGFKRQFPALKYFFVTLRFKDRKRLSRKNWKELSTALEVDGKFCFFGNRYPADREMETAWIKNNLLIERNSEYLDEYERLITEIKKLANYGDGR